MKFTDSHEWIELKDNQRALVGVSKFAQQELGDVVFVELPTVGKKVYAGQAVAVLESTKAAADVYSPIGGTILSVNNELSKMPELVNLSAEEKGWLFEILPDDPAELEGLMSAQDYQDMLNGA